jgi:hypothetical protein
VRQFKNRIFASKNRRRIVLIHNNLLSIFVIERASGLAISLIGQDQTILRVDWTDPIIPTHVLLATFTLPEAASRVTVMGQLSQSAGISWETQ